MAVIVQKYGGSSLRDAEALRRVGCRIAATVADGHHVAVVVSAMGATTDELLLLANQLTPAPDPREQDLLLSTGEIVSMTLLSIALTAAGVPARSFTGPAAGIRTDDAHGNARIRAVEAGPVRAALDSGRVALVAGFQGAAGSGEVTTLGRGGSDTTAVALAAALDAEVCEIYTDVDGVYTADPRLVPTAAKLPHVTYHQMLELAAHGCRVLHDRCVEYARNNHVPLHVRSSFTAEPGTWIGHRAGTEAARTVTGIAHDTGRILLTLHGLPDTGPDRIATLLHALAGTRLPVHDLHVPGAAADLTLTLGLADLPRALAALTPLRDALGYTALSHDTLATVTLVGTGVRADPGVVSRFTQAIRDTNTRPHTLRTTDTTISATTSAASLPGLVRTLHTAFGLDAIEVGPTPASPALAGTADASHGR
ncbi:MAG TPA: aspartate kinase [Jatrophihabitans sp.]|nr:aspartate kinase [Jatrophihabitans sp.]